VGVGWWGGRVGEWWVEWEWDINLKTNPFNPTTFLFFQFSLLLLLFYTHFVGIVGNPL
jgi:hypothetical protein